MFKMSSYKKFWHSNLSDNYYNWYFDDPAKLFVGFRAI